MNIIFEDIIAERKSQDIKWHKQRHSFGVWMTILGEEFGECCGAILGNGNLKSLRGELVQTAAVCVAIIEYIDELKAKQSEETE